ncbi:MAG TPA: hypothetical protein VM659_00555 [Dongiaceae bacterium]|nr:hypothetical protein [Dongiaceae bacterium]
MTEIDWLWNRLEVSGPDPALTDFIGRAQGPGFIPWRWSGGEDREFWSAIALRGGAPSAAAADRLARRFADYLWWHLGEAQTRADLGQAYVPLDLHALRPIPRKVLYAGWHAAGAEWCWKHWGTRLPLRKVTFRFEHRRQRKGAGIDVVAVYDFLSADWSPWLAVKSWRRKWPALNFTLSPLYDLDQVFEPSSMAA